MDKYQADGNIIFKQTDTKITCKRMIYWPNSLNIIGTLSDDIKMQNSSDLLKCDQLVLFESDSKKKYKAKGNINYFQKSKHLQADELIYWSESNNIHLLTNSIISDSLRTIKGDSIHCKYMNENIESLEIFSNGQIINERYAADDSTSLKYLVQDTLQGSDILIFFNNNESVKNVSINGMARANLNVIKHDVLDGKNNISGDKSYL